jgi:hypothetical protein
MEDINQDAMPLLAIGILGMGFGSLLIVMSRLTDHLFILVLASIFSLAACVSLFFFLISRRAWFGFSVAHW